MEREFAAAPEAVGELRQAVRAVVGAGCDAELCVSELVTNVITHVGAGTVVSLCVTARRGGCIRVALTDPDPQRWPVLRRATDDEESGRGLALLDAIARRWGVEQGAHSKTVWCELQGAGLGMRTVSGTGTSPSVMGRGSSRNRP
nr:ATP-binding protein [Streptomyces sp. NA04227]